MSRTKQTAQKQPTGGKPPATYPHRKLLNKKWWIGSSQDKSIPVAVKQARENAKLLSKAANATAQGYYKGLVGPTSSGHWRWYGRRALNEIRFYQENVNLLIQQLPFSVCMRTALWEASNDRSLENASDGCVHPSVGHWSIFNWFTRRCKPYCHSHQKLWPWCPRTYSWLCKSEEREVKRCWNCA